MTIAGVEAYKSEPQRGRSNGNILLYFADVSAETYNQPPSKLTPQIRSGLSNNSLLVADAFADAGFTVRVID